MSKRALGFFFRDRHNRGASVIAGIALLAMFSLLTPAFAYGGQSSLELIAGDWVTPDEDAVIRVRECEANEKVKRTRLCAVLVRHAYMDLSEQDVKNQNPHLRARPLQGVHILHQLKNKNDRKWAGGELYDPRTGKSYSARLKVIDDDMIEIAGCIGPGLCRGYVWMRASEATELMPGELLSSSE